MITDYQKIRDENTTAFRTTARGLIAVWGKEAVQFLNGLITNDVAKMEDNAQMTAAFPNVQGRLVALTRVQKTGDRFLFETDEVTHDKIFQNLFRFTYAGDFFVEDMSENYHYFEVFNSNIGFPKSEIIPFAAKASQDFFVPADFADAFQSDLIEEGAVRLSDELYETIRIENGIPKYGVDMDETTVVLETGIDEAVSFTKGCYIGQEIIARIHFRGHVAKKLTGLILNSPPFEGGVAAVSADGVVTSVSEPSAVADGISEKLESLVLTSAEGKAAGRITSFTYSPKLEKYIALALVRYDYLTAGTKLQLGDTEATVTDLPFIK
jgi:folate-binding protein YgfZ